MIRLRRKERDRRISAAVIGIAIALLSVASLTWVLRSAFHTAERPADEPTPKPPGIFSEVGGWIVYGNPRGIWAVDPSRPGDRKSRVELSSNGGIPLAWSSDGSELLIKRSLWFSRGSSQPGLFVLHSDGTETRLLPDLVNGASFSPDGTTVVFAPSFYDLGYRSRNHVDPGIYLIDADGGVASQILASSRRYIPEQHRSIRTEVYFPTFSPDGTQIAYFDGFGDNSHSLRVVNADGGDLHVLVDNMEAYRISNLVWSPDGTRLAFGRIPDGIYTIGVDGSGLTLVIPGGAYPHWSPDGSRISYQQQNYSSRIGPLLIAAADGTHVVEFGYGGSGGPWNPLVQPEPEVAEVPAASARPTLATTLLSLTIVLALAAGIVMIRHRMRKTRGA